MFWPNVLLIKSDFAILLIYLLLPSRGHMQSPAPYTSYRFENMIIKNVLSTKEVKTVLT